MPLLAARSAQIGLRWVSVDRISALQDHLYRKTSCHMARLIGQEGTALCSANAGSLHYIINTPFAPHMGTIEIQYMSHFPLLFVTVERPPIPTPNLMFVFTKEIKKCTKVNAKNIWKIFGYSRMICWDFVHVWIIISMSIFLSVDAIISLVG